MRFPLRGEHVGCVLGAGGEGSVEGLWGPSENVGSVGKEGRSRRGCPFLASPGSRCGSVGGDQNWWETESELQLACLC